AEEHPRRELPYLRARRAPNGLVGRDDCDLLAPAVLSSEPLDQRVGVGGPTDGERAELLVLAAPVEDEHAARALAGDPAREQVAQLVRRAEPARVQQVEAVEEIERRLSHRAAAAPRRATPPPRR